MLFKAQRFLYEQDLFVKNLAELKNWLTRFFLLVFHRLHFGLSRLFIIRQNLLVQGRFKHLLLLFGPRMCLTVEWLLRFTEFQKPKLPLSILQLTSIISHGPLKFIAPSIHHKKGTVRVLNHFNHGVRMYFDMWFDFLLDQIVSDLIPPADKRHRKLTLGATGFHCGSHKLPFLHLLYFFGSHQFFQLLFLQVVRDRFHIFSESLLLAGRFNLQNLLEHLLFVVCGGHLLLCGLLLE